MLIHNIIAHVHFCVSKGYTRISSSLGHCTGINIKTTPQILL